VQGALQNVLLAILLLGLRHALLQLSAREFKKNVIIATRLADSWMRDAVMAWGTRTLVFVYHHEVSDMLLLLELVAGCGI
jgi:hypothetical protein